MSDMPPVFEINACFYDLTISELDWTASDAAKSYAFTYGWVRASQARGLVKEIERLSARVEVLEKALHCYANDYKNGHCARIALSHSSSLSTSSLEAQP
jgi:hypothetical protein